MEKWVRRNPTKSAVGGVAAVLMLVIGWLGLIASQRADELAGANDELAGANDELWVQTETALEQERLATQRADDLLRLSAAQDLEDLMVEQAALWPLHPEHLAAYRDWIERASELVADLPLHLAKREELRALALPQSEEERLAEREGHPESGRLAPQAAELGSMRNALAVRRGELAIELPALDRSALPEDTGAWNGVAWELVKPGRTSYGQEARGLAIAQEALVTAPDSQRASILDTIAWARLALGDDEGALATSEAALEAASDEEREAYQGSLDAVSATAEAAGTQDALAAASERVAELEQELAELQARVGERQDWRFAEEHEEARWWNAQLTQLIEALGALEGEHMADDAITAAHGWSVAKRMVFAERLEAGFAPGGEYDEAWQRDLPAIRDAYPGLELTPQLGLVPLGPDPESGLWEFAQLATGAPAERGADGRLVLTEETGVVLVLIPAGSFWMGAQQTDEAGRNHDRGAALDEEPVHEVGLSAYFLSKYEMTQGQWMRATGVNPSYYQPPGGLAPSLLHPVEQVSWFDCMQALERIGLSLPSEAQWECGARAGTDTAWCFGSEREDLRAKVNIADKTAADSGADWTGLQDWPEHEDGSVVHAEVGSYPANSFGLHEVHGNLWEWCLDGWDSGFYAEDPEQDPVAPWQGSVGRVNRGGSYNYAASDARSADRGYDTPESAGSSLGLRPAQGITP